VSVCKLAGTGIIAAGPARKQVGTGRNKDSNVDSFLRKPPVLVVPTDVCLGKLEEKETDEPCLHAACCWHNAALGGTSEQDHRVKHLQNEPDGSCRMYRRAGARYHSERIKDDLNMTLHRPNSWGNS
jgi:hypothetical protein